MMLQYIHLIGLKVALFLRCGACREKPYQAGSAAVVGSTLSRCRDMRSTSQN